MLALGTCFIGVTVAQLPAPNPGSAGWPASGTAGYSLIDALRLNRIFTSPWFLVTSFCFMLSLGYSLAGQFGKAKTAFFAAPPVNLPVPGELRIKVAGTVTDKAGNTAGAWLPMLNKHLQRKGFRPTGTTGDTEKIFVFRKNRWGVWGTLVFHTGLLFLVIAAFFTYALEKRGFVQLIEGDTFSGRTGDFITVENGPWTAGFETGFRLHLQKFHHAYWDTGDLKELSNDIVIYDGAGERHAILDKGTPATVGNVRIYQSGYYGYTVKLSLMEGAKEAVPSYFSLAMADKGKPLVGKSDFPMTGYICDFKFYPDVRDNSPYPRAPLLQVRFFRDAREIKYAALSPGEETVVEGRRFRFTEVRSWSGLILRENKALPLAYLGFFASTGGIFMLYMLIPQTIFLSLAPAADGGLIVAADLSCRRGKRLLLAELRETINGVAPWKI